MGGNLPDRQGFRVPKQGVLKPAFADLFIAIAKRKSLEERRISGWSKQEWLCICTHALKSVTEPVPC